MSSRRGWSDFSLPTPGVQPQQKWGLRGPSLTRPFASSQGTPSSSGEVGTRPGNPSDQGDPDAWHGNGQAEGTQEGGGSQVESDDGESSDEESPLPGGRRAEEITQMLQAREDATRPFETKADAFGPPKQDMEEWLSYFRMKVVDVNRTSRGSPTGGIGRFSALVVVGNGNGVIGLGMGKSTALGEAVKKANRQAMKTLFYVPRYNKATILHPLVAKYGQCKVTMYPRSSGRGAIASNLISDICRLAGIADIGVKVHGTRNVRNTVKALIQGFESQIVPQEQIELPLVKADKLKRRKVKGVPTVQTAGLLGL